jgi:RND family efflux transporter MFP subunit
MPESFIAEPAPAAVADAPLHRPRHLKLVGLASAAVAVVLVAAGLISRSTASAQLKTWTDEQATPTVALAPVSAAAGAGALVLPGQVEAFNSAELNARVTGYLKTWTADIGQRVKAGQSLAVLEAPELNQQLQQAQADLLTTQANAKLAASTNQRYVQLLKDEAASKQDAEEKAGDLDAKNALVAAAQANVRRLAETYGFTRITAPFDGVVTARNAQLGQLVVAGAPTTPMFVVADDSKLRIYVRVPQPYISQLHTGETAQLTVPEHPDRTFAATLVRTSNAVDRTSGTLTAELSIDNTDHALKPGEYAQTRFAIASPPRTVSLPSSAILFREGGMMVGVVGAGDKVRLQKVAIARDLGATVEIASGVSRSDRVIDNPTDTLTDGQRVRVATPAQSAATAAAHG